MGIFASLISTINSDEYSSVEAVGRAWRQREVADAALQKEFYFRRNQTEAHI